MGIDWGTASRPIPQRSSAKCCCVCRFQIVYCHRFEGANPSLPDTAREDLRPVSQWRPDLIGGDYGGGFDRNDAMIRKFGPTRVFKYQYSTITSGKEMGRRSR